MTAPLQTGYTLRSIQQMLGVSRAVIMGLIDAGFVSPSRGVRSEYRFTFPDVLLLRTAHALKQADLSARKIHRSLARLKATLPDEIPLSGLRITAVGGDIAVHDGDAQWEAESGQLLMDFEVKPVRGGVVFMQRPSSGVQVPLDDSRTCFALAQTLEADDSEGAARAYRRAIEIDPGCEAAYLNLGAMLCDAGRCKEALELFDTAIARCPTAALHFNRAIALEDQRRVEDALASYETCLALSPDLADAHFNAARLHEQLGQFQAALRHFNAYRRLERNQEA